MKLNDRQIRNAKPRDKDYKLADGGGLYLLVKPGGAKYWRIKYRAGGKEKLLAVGVYPAVSLADARARRDEVKRLLAKGEDPGAKQKDDRSQAQGAFLFESVARQWLASNLTWSDDHRARVIRSLEQYVFPSVGTLDVRTVRTGQLLVPVKAVDDAGKHDVAQRLQQRITAIMRFAVRNALTDINPASDMAGALTVTRVKHHPALPPARLHEFLTRLGAFRGRLITRLAVELTLLTFVRSSELRFARWTEIDFDKAVWTIPGVREPLPGVRFSGRGMKMKTEHIIPLSRQALDVLTQLHALSGRGVVLFPNDHNTGGVMSEGTVNKALRSMGYDTKTELCGHGFRTMARGALGESGLWRESVIERQLSHCERNNVKRAYLHTSEYTRERRLMLQWWADYLDASRAASITPFDFAGVTGSKQ